MFSNSFIQSTMEINQSISNTFQNPYFELFKYKKNQVDSFNLEQFNKREPYVFEYIFKKYYSIIFDYLYHKTKGDFDVTQDILSETFLIAFKVAPKLTSISNIKNWLLKIAFRKLMDYLRKKYNILHYKNNLLNELSINENYFDDDSFNQLHRKEKLYNFEIALNNVKSLYKEILIQKYIENKKQKELSILFNRSEAAIESLLIRAKKSLKHELKKLDKQ